MARHTPQQQFKEAKQIASDHGLFVVERSGKFQLYRKNDIKNIYLGTRGSASGLRQLVCSVTGFR